MNDPTATARHQLMSEVVDVVPYDPAWCKSFQALARPIRDALGDMALRIDHIGSTAIAGLDAKPVIDIQVSVADLEPVDAYARPLASLGYVWRADNPDLTKRYFREPGGQRRTHVHVRGHGSWSEQAALLFRDYLRTDSSFAQRYAELKRHLASQHRADRERYTEAKGPFIWEVMRAANDWSMQTGWVAGPSDA